MAEKTKASFSDVALPLIGALMGAASPGLGMAAGQIAGAFGEQRERNRKRTEEEAQEEALRSTFQNVYGGDPNLEALAAVDPAQAINVARDVRGQKRQDVLDQRYADEEERRRFTELEERLTGKGRERAQRGVMRLLDAGDVEGARAMAMDAGMSPTQIESVLTSRGLNRRPEEPTAVAALTPAQQQQYKMRLLDIAPAEVVNAAVTAQGVDTAMIEPYLRASQQPQPKAPTTAQVLAARRFKDDLDDKINELNKELDEIQQNLLANLGDQQAAPRGEGFRVEDINAATRRRAQDLHRRLAEATQERAQVSDWIDSMPQPYNLIIEYPGEGDDMAAAEEGPAQPAGKQTTTTPVDEEKTRRAALAAAGFKVQ